MEYFLFHVFFVEKAIIFESNDKSDNYVGIETFIIRYFIGEIVKFKYITISFPVIKNLT